MPFKGFEGPAGTGKTFQLIEAVKAQVAATPLEPHQRVLALTFMHGSRRRLEERLRSVPELQGGFTCMTIDSFARSVLERWFSLAAAIGIQAGDFDQTCESCGRLLEAAEVAGWVVRSDTQQ